MRKAEKDKRIVPLADMVVTVIRFARMACQGEMLPLLQMDVNRAVTVIFRGKVDIQYSRQGDHDYTA